jgi:hypothetical protein
VKDKVGPSLYAQYFFGKTTPKIYMLEIWQEGEISLFRGRPMLL